jgi:hypothetical protein
MIWQKPSSPILPPEIVTPTRLSRPSTLPVSSAASAEAPLGSVTSLRRARQSTSEPQRVASIRDPAGSVIKVQSLDMPDPVVDPGQLAAIAARDLNECFYAAGFHQPDASIPRFVAEAPFVPVVELAAGTNAPQTVRRFAPAARSY